MSADNAGYDKLSLPFPVPQKSWLLSNGSKRAKTPKLHYSSSQTLTYIIIMCVCRVMAQRTSAPFLCIIIRARVLHACMRGGCRHYANVDGADKPHAAVFHAMAFLLNTNNKTCECAVCGHSLLVASTRRCRRKHQLQYI